MGAKDALTKRLEKLAKSKFDKFSEEKTAQKFDGLTKTHLKGFVSKRSKEREQQRNSLGMDENMSDTDYYEHIKHIQAEKQDHGMLEASGKFSDVELEQMRSRLAAQEQELARLRAGQARPASKFDKFMAKGKGLHGMEANATEAAGTGAEDPEKEAERERERQEEIKKETEEEKQKIEEEKKTRIEKLKQKRDEKLEIIKNGPPGYIMLIARLAFFLLWIMDTIVGLIPFVGDALAAGISFIVWAILCIILIGDLGTVGKIIAFLFIDFIAGFIPGVGDILDPGVELVALFTKRTPFHMFKKAYQLRIPKLSQHLRQVYDEKIKLVVKEEDSKFNRFKSSLQGHFTGLAVDNQKIVFLIMFVIIAILGPMGLGILMF